MNSVFLIPAPYVRVLQLNPHGRVVKKKKTSARQGTKDPSFGETLTFDALSAEAMENWWANRIFEHRTYMSCISLMFFARNSRLIAAGLQCFLSRHLVFPFPL